MWVGREPVHTSVNPGSLRSAEREFVMRQFCRRDHASAAKRSARGARMKAALVLAAAVIVAIGIGDPIIGPALGWAHRIAFATLTLASPAKSSTDEGDAEPLTAASTDGYVEALTKIIAS